VRGVLERDRRARVEAQALQRQEVDGRVRFVRRHLVAARRHLDAGAEAGPVQVPAHPALRRAAGHGDPQVPGRGLIEPLPDARGRFEAFVQPIPVRAAAGVARRPVEVRPDRLGEQRVPLLGHVPAVVGEEPLRVEDEAVLLPLVAPALQQRALGIHQQAVEVEDQRPDRHASDPATRPGSPGPRRKPVGQRY
jgi:hypothetical protein